MRRSDQTISPRALTVLPAAWTITLRRTRWSALRSPALAPIGGWRRARHRKERCVASRRLRHQLVRPAYVAGALSFSNHWFTTDRSSLGDALTANFIGQGYGARLEGGYRVGFCRVRCDAVRRGSVPGLLYAGLQRDRRDRRRLRALYNARRMRPTCAPNLARASTIRRWSMASRSFCSAASPGRTTLSEIPRGAPRFRRCRAARSRSTARRSRTTRR